MKYKDDSQGQDSILSLFAAWSSPQGPLSTKNLF